MIRGEFVPIEDLGGLLQCTWAGCAETCEKAPDGAMPPGWHMVLSTRRSRVLTPGGRASIAISLEDLGLDAQLCPAHFRALLETINPALTAPPA
jgi:hypothetical protein